MCSTNLLPSGCEEAPPPIFPLYLSHSTCRPFFDHESASITIVYEWMRHLEDI